MGRQRNNPKKKEKGEVSETTLNEKESTIRYWVQRIGYKEASERMLNEIESSQLSDTEFKAMVIRKLTELRENYQKLQGNCNEQTENYINRKKKTETIKKGQE